VDPALALRSPREQRRTQLSDTPTALRVVVTEAVGGFDGDGPRPHDIAPGGLDGPQHVVDAREEILRRGARAPQVVRRLGQPRMKVVIGCFLRGLRDWGWAWAREIVDSIRTFSISQPLLAGRAFAVGAPHDERLPVLLIHGYFCNRALWRPMAARLVAGGHVVEAINLEPPFASIDDYVPRIAAAVAALRDRTGAPQVALVGHSMGGLAARAYLRACGDEAVACVVTLGTPHRGTVHAHFGRGRNVRQMRRDNNWLRQLAAEEPRERLERFTVVLSMQDNIVAPQAIQTLVGVRTVRLHGLGHISLVYDAQVARIVMDTLSAAEAGLPARSASPSDSVTR
jgi:pimeloyl-ACP methyl ester carboxylesterase